ncbi:hypothetical protein ACWODI_06030 [Facklamia languida]
MLTKIACDFFMVNGKPRGDIFFKEGLNIILGGGTGANSIGKSTMLLIIDFAFGGNEYRNSDAVKELGNHTIYFTFKFNGIDYEFSRNTAESNIIIKYSEKEKEVLSLNDFTNWLGGQYNLNFNNVSFRSILSRFFRIYGKENYNEFRPLQMNHENMDKAITVLVTLYGFYDSVAAFREQNKIAEDKLKIFKSARKYNFISSTTVRKSKYKDNIDRITKLQEQKFQLRNSTSQQFNQEEVDKANRSYELDQKMKVLQRNIRNQQNKFKNY